MKYSRNFKMLKSVLKKPSLGSSDGNRHVTFCKTVQVYTNSSLKPDEKLINFESLPRPVIRNLTFESLFSKHLEPEQFHFDSNDEPTDFFVHKVVYDEDNLNLSDSSEDLKTTEEEEEENNDSDPEKEEFVVHQVVRQNDEDLDETGEEDLDNSIDHSTNVDHEIVCELSVQNIEQHNKYLDGHVLPHVDDPLVMASLEHTDIVLSPPLQELGVNRLIDPQSHNWFWNLDISPLNSVQETDSDSNISSEDTMIMMTSEESAKNEQRIQESLQKFESLKKKNAQDDIKSEQMLEEHASIDIYRASSLENCKNISLVGESRYFKVESESKPLNSDTNSENLDSTIQENHNKELYDSVNACDTSVAPSIEEKSMWDVASTSSREILNTWDKDLTAIEIPKDVREWKICINKESVTKLPNIDSELDNVIESKVSDDQIKTECSVNEHCVDELEHFADQCTERVERIRKRYSINENMLWTPRRGIRPRFGSSAEILQHIPNGHHLLLSYTASSSSHYSWPYYDSADEQESNNLQKPDTIDFLTTFLPHTSLTDLDSYHFRQQPVERLEHLFQENEASCVSATNKLACSLPPFYERGTPEGASPPRLSSESLCDSEKLELSKSVVYYSMEV